MNLFLILAAGSGVWWCLFNIARIGSLDPHHVQATPAPWILAAKATLTFVALLMLPVLSELKPDLVPFFSMFALAQTVAVAFTSPDMFREDEESSAMARTVARLKSSIGGALMAKILSIVLAFLTAWLIGKWWFVALVAIGLMLVIGKGMTALLMIQSEQGEFRQLSKAGRRKWRNGRRSS